MCRTLRHIARHIELRHWVHAATHSVAWLCDIFFATHPTHSSSVVRTQAPSLLEIYPIRQWMFTFFQVHLELKIPMHFSHSWSTRRRDLAIQSSRVDWISIEPLRGSSISIINLDVFSSSDWSRSCLEKRHPKICKFSIWLCRLYVAVHAQ